jgi:DNA-binding NarL/FixJ family response regulator
MAVSLPKVLIVDDHKVVAEGMVRLLSDHFDIVGTLTDGRLVLEAVCRLHPDVILLDISMPHVSGLEAMRQLRERGIDFKAIVLTMHADAALAVDALRTGASGFVLKESGGDELMTALQVVLAGGTYLAADLTKDIVTLMVDPTDPSRIELTTRQQEVLRLIVRGQRAKEIAGTLEMSTRSVEAVKYKIMQLLNVHSTAELVRYAVEHHLVAF